MNNNLVKDRKPIELVEVSQPNLPRKVCFNHDAIACLTGHPCPHCNRRSISAYEYD
jgi:hypothetical protein